MLYRRTATGYTRTAAATKLASFMERRQLTRLMVAGCIGVAVAATARSASPADPQAPADSMVEPIPLSLTPAYGVGVPQGATAPDMPRRKEDRPKQGQWNFSAGVSGTLTLTDNVELAPSGQQESDLVLGLSLPMGIRREGSRMKLEAEYIPTVYLYARNNESDDLQNNLRSLMSVEAVDDFFFVDAVANTYPTYISPLAPRPESGASITNNRTQQITLGFSPYIQRQTDRGWQYLFRNDNFWNTYTESGLSNTLASRFFADVASPPTRLSYALDYTYLYTRDQSADTSYYQQIGRFRPILRATRTLKVSARLGYESNDYEVTRYSGSVYGAGIDWTPSPRTRLEGFLEHRFFGASYALSFNHRTRRTSWRLNGTRNTYTTIDQPLTLRPGTTAEVLDDAFRSRIADPAQREQAVQQFLTSAGLPPTLTQQYSFYTPQIYLANQVTGSVALLGRRNTIELTLFWQENEPITASGAANPGIVVGFNEFRQQGITLNFSHRLSALSTVTFSANRVYARTTDPTVSFSASRIESTQDALRLSWTRQLGPGTDGSLGVRWVNFDSDVSPYQELAGIAALIHSF